MKILAGIVLYNPDLKRLQDNINRIESQVDRIICIDNGSNNINEIKSAFIGKVDFIENSENKGIATALNQILNYAKDNLFDWFITLDQDSVCENGLNENYLKYTGTPSAAILTCRIEDRNFKEEIIIEDNFYEITQCITSASFCNTKALISVGGFDNKMFIDGVDFDICLAVRKKGYKVYRVNYLGLIHEVGHGKNVRFFGRKKIIYNHSAIRNYYISRNHIYLAKKYPDFYSMTKIILKEIEGLLLIIFYEGNKCSKIALKIRGIFDGLRNKMGKIY